MKKQISKNLNWIIPVFLIILAGLFVMGSSPVYKTNPWWDTNAMFAMGKAWLHGYVPLKNIIDQRGPVLYFIYAIAAFLMPHSFHALWLIEIINAVIVYFLSVRIAKVLKVRVLSPHWAGLLGPLVLLGTNSFFYGGSPEEFAFPSILYLLFLLLKYRDDLTKISLISYFLVGLNFALVFWSKYSLTGAFLMFFLIVLYVFLKKRDFQQLGKVIAASFGGFALISAIILLYYLVVNGIHALFEVYFVQNMTMYNPEIPGIAAKLIHWIAAFVALIQIHIFLFLVLLVDWAIAIYKKEPVLFEIITYVGLMGLVAYSYMGIGTTVGPQSVLVGLPFLVIALIRLVSYVPSRLTAGNREAAGLLIGFLCILMFAIPYLNNVYLTGLIPKTSETSLSGATLTAQHDFGKYMKRHAKHPTMLFLGGIDRGFFKAADTYPTTPFYQELSLENPSKMDKSFVKTFKHKKVKYVVAMMAGNPGTKRHVYTTFFAALDPKVPNVAQAIRKPLFQNYRIKKIAVDGPQPTKDFKSKFVSNFLWANNSQTMKEFTNKYFVLFERK